MAGTSKDIKHIDIREFRERGYVHEINRLLLHPLGLALEVNVDPSTGEESLGGVWDGRDDPEGFIYDAPRLNALKGEKVAAEIEERGAARMAGLGYVIQPLPQETTQLTLHVLEHTVTRIAPPGAFDQGEEQARGEHEKLKERLLDEAQGGDSDVAA